MAARLDGRLLAGQIEARLIHTIAGRLAAVGRPPGLAVLRVGDDPASGVYVANKEKACARVGITSLGTHLLADTPAAEVLAAVHREEVPVISPVASEEGTDNVLNVNADVAAAALAGKLRASKFVYISDVLGVMRNPGDPASLIPSLDREGVERLVNDGTIRGGMIPKVRSALSALDAGVQKVHMIDGRIPHSLLLEIFTNQGIGTEIVP